MATTYALSSTLLGRDGNGGVIAGNRRRGVALLPFDLFTSQNRPLFEHARLKDPRLGVEGERGKFWLIHRLAAPNQKQYQACRKVSNG